MNDAQLGGKKQWSKEPCVRSRASTATKEVRCRWTFAEKSGYTEMVLPLYFKGPFSLARHRIATLSWKLRIRAIMECGGAPGGEDAEECDVHAQSHGKRMVRQSQKCPSANYRGDFLGGSPPPVQGIQRIAGCSCANDFPKRRFWHGGPPFPLYGASLQQIGGEQHLQGS